MNRDAMLAALDRGPEPWDVAIVGGGASGLGVAVEAAARGYRAVLLEGGDFAQGTSSRSTKLVHGGVRYLRQGNIALVLDALRERGTLLRNAPHLVRSLPFVVPNYDWWEGPFYGIGLKLYDLLAGKQGLGRSKLLSRERTLELIPTLEPEGLVGGVIYHDGQFDDARLALALAQTAADQGAVLLNYVAVVGLLKEGGEVRGVVVLDQEGGGTREVRARVVVNATGAFTDEVRRLDDPAAAPMLALSQGVHVVLERSFLPGDSAVMVPKTDDGRVLFAIPWQGHVLVGTTETPVPEPNLEPRPHPEEVDFLLEHAARYLVKNPTRADVRSTFAGLRPLVAGETDEGTGALARDHTLHISASGLLTVTGGKWTTYRRMGEEAVDQAAVLGELEERPSPTRTLRLHGHHTEAGRFGHLATYGSRAPEVRELIGSRPDYGERLHPEHPLLGGQVVWAARHEMARTVDDVLARRTRALLLDARAAMAMAPEVARLLAEELGRDATWTEAQVASFHTLAEGYLPS